MQTLRGNESVNTKRSIEKELVWTTQDGDRIPVSKMRTTHLFYALRMIWNHTVPVAMKLPGGEYRGPESWSVENRRKAVVAFLAELNRRNDLPFTLCVQLGIMRDRARELNQKRILEFNT